MPRTIEFSDAELMAFASVAAKMAAPIVAPPAPAPAGFVANARERLARDVRDKVAVCVDGRLNQADRVAQQLDMLNVRGIRIQLVAAGQSRLPLVAALVSAMVKRRMAQPSPWLMALVMAYMNDPTTAAQQVQPIVDAAKMGVLRYLEGPNEISNKETGGGSHGINDRTYRSGDADWPGVQAEWAKWMADLRAARPELAGTRLLTPSLQVMELARFKLAQNLAKLGLDGAAVHYYAGGGQAPSLVDSVNPDIGYFDNIRRLVCSGQGFPDTADHWLTECGAATCAGQYNSGGRSQAKYVANQLFEAATMGLGSCFYQLEDGATGGASPESNFGLFRTTGSDGAVQPKSAVGVIAKWQDALSLGRDWRGVANVTDNRAVTPGFDVSKIAVSGIDHPPSTGRPWQAWHLSDGSTVIAVSNGGQRTDDGRGNNIEVPMCLASIDFGATVPVVRVVDPLDDSVSAKDTPIANAGVSKMQFPLTGYPKLLLLSNA